MSCDGVEVRERKSWNTSGVISWADVGTMNPGSTVQRDITDQ